MTRDADKELLVVLGYLAGRQLSQKQAQEALGVSRSTFTEQYATGGLINAARALNINPVDLLVRYEIISPESVLEYVQDNGLIDQAHNNSAPTKVRWSDLGPQPDADQL